MKGSFRGVEFCWRHSGVLVGRKTARHDYPQRDEAYTEDLGKLPREFNLECFVIGRDYIDQRDNLIQALETKGAGTLMHPTMGMMQVCLNGPVRMTESNDEGGMCRFDIPFILAPQENMFFPSAGLDTALAVDTHAGASIGAGRSSFGARFSVAGRPQFVAADGLNIIGKFRGGIRGVAESFPANAKTPALMLDIDTLEKTEATLINTPAILSETITGLFTSLRTAALEPLSLMEDAISDDGITSRYDKALNLPTTLFNAYSALCDFGTSTSSISTLSSNALPRTTPARIAQAANRDALNALIRVTAIAEAARTASTIDYISYDAAVALMTRLLAAIDAEMLVADDSVYATLVDLRAAVVKDINTRGANLARIIKYTPVTTEPALVIAQRLYGDATRAEEIIARNNIRHPLFVPGGVALEVLNV